MLGFNINIWHTGDISRRCWRSICCFCHYSCWSSWYCCWRCCCCRS